MQKITVIGTGNVGSTIAYTLAVSSIASEIVLIDINSEKALGEALDIRQGMSFASSARIYAGSYMDAKDSDIVVITSGVARKAGQSRLDLAQINVNILKSITPEIVKYAPDAIYVIVSNPLDIMTYAFNKFSHLPEDHIIGSGTCLDTARLQARLAEYYSIDQQDVHAMVLGEHGDSSFVPWSLANISGVPVDQYSESLVNCNRILPPMEKTEVETYMRKSGARIIGRKGATFYAVSLSVAHICKCIGQDTNSLLTVSSMMHGEYGIEDCCLSLLSIVGGNGLNGKLVMPMTDEEVEKLRRSAEAIKAVQSSVTF